MLSCGLVGIEFDSRTVDCAFDPLPPPHQSLLYNTLCDVD